MLALSTCAYLAAVYLTNETRGELREDFRLRAIGAGTTTAVLAGLVGLFAWQEANWFFWRLLSLKTLPVIIAGLICFAGSAWSVFTRRYSASRLFAAGEITLVILGWGLSAASVSRVPRHFVRRCRRAGSRRFASWCCRCRWASL